MGAISAQTVERHSFGAKNLIIAKFEDKSGQELGNGQTWDSGLGSHSAVYAYWINCTNNPTLIPGCTVAESSGVFTFYIAETSNGHLYILTDK